MRASFSFLAATLVIASAGTAVAQQIVAQPGVGAGYRAPDVVNSYVPPGTPVQKVVTPDTPQAPGTSVVYMPQGTPLVSTPYTSLGYARASAPVITAPTSPAPVITSFADGTKVEIDPDNSVRQLFPDGARASATDGVHQMVDGSYIMVKDGRKVQ